MSTGSSSCQLWPRHEVLQLINPAISHSGRAFSQGLVIEAVRQLAKLQSPDTSIRYYFVVFISLLYYSFSYSVVLYSFQQWYSVARDLLKWSDSFIRL